MKKDNKGSDTSEIIPVFLNTSANNITNNNKPSQPF